MQIVAMITMLIDHIGIVFFPDSDVWRIIGRIALPIYAYGIVQGFLHTRSRARYLRRLTVLAAVSQLPYMLGLNTLGINTIGTLAVCLGVLMLADRYPGWGAFAGAAAAILVLDTLPFSYGFYALFLILVYRYLDGKYWVAAHMALNLLSIAYDSGWQLQLFSIIPTFFFAYRHTLFAELKLGISPPGWLWRSFYPAHLAALALLSLWLNK
ncbi:TraX family protein [Paenibacillus sp. MBLB4367]|uniref:TraX family protein n=1 Tax=Paenibacillus sp. MBLB4367 TaxID=3384767 RepID=UPI003907F29B